MDYNLFFSIVSLLIGVLIGWLIAHFRIHRWHLLHESERVSLEHGLKTAQQLLSNEQHIRKQTELMMHNSQREQRDLLSRLATAEERLTFLIHFRQECEQLNNELKIQREINSNKEAELREITIRLEETKSIAEEKQRLLVNSEQRLLAQFENLANRIFEHNGRKVDEQNRQSLDLLLIPLREQLETFRRQIQDSFGQEARERHTLTYEIHKLQQLNTQMTQETINLTRALKGNHKTQGNWGEIVLSKVLEASGLREGHEFETQLSLQQEDGRRIQPDVIVRLPHGKDVIIDAKISLVAYERYFNSDNDTTRQIALTEHINSLRTHIKLLGRKDYQKLPGLRSLDYVLLFVPIEPAFMTAINWQPELITEAVKHNIMLVSPTTLFVALRTINNLWRYEHQNRNAQHIAERASNLYDKLRLFVDDINAIGQNLDKALASFQLAKKKLFSGRSNIISQAEGFRAMGVEIRRPITSVSENHISFVDDTNSNETKTSINDLSTNTINKHSGININE